MHWETVLRWLALLACPLMMLLCMRGMLGRACHRDHGDAAADPEVHALKERVARLEAELERARAESGS